MTKKQLKNRRKEITEINKAENDKHNKGYNKYMNQILEWKIIREGMN